MSLPHTDSEALVFKYAKPEIGERGKTVAWLARSSQAFCAVQAVREGGENNLHSHPTLDGFWFVLRGRASFYTTDDLLVAELSENEGILIPHDYPYWFESSGDVDLEIFQVETAVAGTLHDDINHDRVDHSPRH